MPVRSHYLETDLRTLLAKIFARVHQFGERIAGG